MKQESFRLGAKARVENSSLDMLKSTQLFQIISSYYLTLRAQFWKTLLEPLAQHCAHPHHQTRDPRKYKRKERAF